MGRLLLIRHGESEGNRDRAFTATPLVGLTPAGREQVAAAAGWIAEGYRPAYIVTSPFARARQTAAILADRLKVPVHVDEDLRERCYGELAGQPYGSARTSPGWDPMTYWLWCPPGGGETLVEVSARAGAALDRVAAAAPSDDVIVVSHGAVMVSLWKHVTGEWNAGKVARNAGIVVVTHEAGRYVGAVAID